MSRLEKVENEVKQLTPDELRIFRGWFSEFDAAVWDKQFETDVTLGKLDTLADRALKDHKRGKSTDL